MSSKLRYIFTYFDCMYRAEPVRLMFAYAGVQYEDKRIEEYTEWPKMKSSTPTGKLPILEVDGRILTESQAILRYLARTFGLAGKNDWEAAKCDMLAGGAEDLYMVMRDYFHEIDPDKANKMNEEMKEGEVIPFLVRYEKFLEENKTGYFVGDQLTWTDLVVFHYATVLIPKFCSLESYPKLQEFTHHIGNIEPIKKWIEKRPKHDL